MENHSGFDHIDHLLCFSGMKVKISMKDGSSSTGIIHGYFLEDSLPDNPKVLSIWLSPGSVRLNPGPDSTGKFQGLKININEIQSIEKS